MTGIDLSISAAGEPSAAVLGELEGFVVRRQAGRVVLRGHVADQAALMGVLARLRRDGLTIRHVVPVRGRAPSRPARPHRPGPPRAVAEVGLVGLVADLVGPAIEGAEVTQDPATTTVRVRLADPDALFALLDRLEDLALEVREIHVRPPVGGCPEDPVRG